tara:strand:- start:69 stop:320 length:252 start_codon:yes stop_codon:yes gene_type:complete
MKTLSKKSKNNKLVNFIRKLFNLNTLIILILIIFLYFLYFLFNKKKLVENLNVDKIKNSINKLDEGSEEGGESSDNFMDIAAS